MDGVAALVVLICALSFLLNNTQRLGNGVLVFFIRQVLDFMHTLEYVVSFFQRIIGIADGIIGRRAVAQTNQHSGFPGFQIRGVLSKIVAAGSLDSIAVVAVKVGVAVEFHNVCLGIFFFYLRGKKNFYDFSGKAPFLSQVCIFNDLLGNGGAALGDLPTVFYQSQSRTEGSDPVYSCVAFKTPILLGNVGILQVHADILNGDIFIVTGIDQANELIVFVIDLCVGKQLKVLPLHLSQLVVGDLPAVIQIRLYLCID